MIINNEFLLKGRRRERLRLFIEQLEYVLA
jgi:hypothetical protein